MLRRRLVQTLAVAVTMRLFAVAAEADTPPGRELLLFDEPVVSAAAKHEQSVRDAPSAVTVITGDEIRRFGYRTLAEVLGSVRGFHRSSDRNYDYLGVRGFLRPGDYNDRVLLLVNGHTYNDDIYQTAPVGTDFGIDLEAVERIEVIRGPGSALYGGNALFAVVNVVTSTGAGRPGIRLLAETGSYGRRRGQATAGRAFDNGLDLFLSGSFLEIDGAGVLYYPEYDDPSTNYGLARRADGERAANIYASARYGDFAFQGGANERHKHVPTGAFETTFDDNGTFTTDTKVFADAQYSGTVTRDLTLTGRAYYDRYDYDGSYIYGTGSERVENIDNATSDWFGTEARALWFAPHANTVTLGAEYTYHPGARQENFTPAAGESLLNDRRTFNNWGVYLQDEFAIMPRVTLVGGVRYDRYYNRVDHFSPRGAAIWRPLDETTVKLLYGRAFRAPNLFEQYYAYDSEGTISLSNPELKPEKISTYEAVIEQRLWRESEGTIAAYHYEIDGLIDQEEVPADDPDSTAIQYHNLSGARATGVEMELRVHLPYNIAGRAAYSLQRAEATGGAHLSNSPRHLGNIGVLCPLPHGLHAAGELVVVGPRRTLHGGEVPTATIANVNLTYAAPLPGLDLSAGFYNLLDRRYADPAGAEHAQERIPHDGFTFRVQVRYAF